MNLILLSAGGIGILLALTFLFLLRTVTSANEKQTLPGDWENMFAPSRYKPMERLLDAADQEYLASQASYSWRMGRRFRANRIAIFRGYARCLGRDFTRISNALKVVMVHAAVDRSALAGLLLKQRLLFSYNLMSIEVKLTLHAFGWSAPTVDVANLVGALDAMRAQLRALSAVTVASAA